METGLAASLVHVENQLVGLVIIDVEGQLDADEEEVNFTSTRMYNLHFQQ